MTPLSPITLVIPVFNRASTLERTLESIGRQTVQPAAVIIVDNGSTDGSLEIATRWADGVAGNSAGKVTGEIQVIGEPRRGACAARNRGLEAVSTEWTMFFDSDDVMLPHHVADFTRAILDNPGASILGRDIFTMHLDGRRRRNYYRAGRDAMFHHLFRGSLSTQRYAARTDLFRRVGAWDESLSGWNDFELGVRLLLSGAVTATVPGTPSVIAWQQAESITGTSFSANPERWERSLDKIGRAFSDLSLTDGELSKRYLKWLDARCMILAAQYAREAARLDDMSLRQKASDLSHAMRSKVMNRTAHPRLMHLIYAHNLHFNRLTWALVRVLSHLF